MITKDYLKDLYLTKAQSLFFFASRFVDSETAEDIVQDAFLKLWDNREKIFASETINSYLFQIVKNACLDNLKHESVKNKVFQELSIQLRMDEIEYYTKETFSIENRKIEQIHQLIENLPERCKEIFIAAYFENKRNKDIASELNISIRTVDAQIYKALSIIRKNLFPILQFFPLLTPFLNYLL
jgi:RNA polymerase sigma-70 factor (ECF subfamily)